MVTTNDFDRRADGSPSARGFSYIESMIALAIIVAAMSIAMVVFVKFGRVMKTESTTLSTQQAGRVIIDELARASRDIGYGTTRRDTYNAASWQRGLIHGSSHTLVFNADIDDSVGILTNTQTVTFPVGSGYTGEGIGATQVGAETYVFTLDANGDGAITAADRSQAATGNYNPAMDTENSLDFAIFRRVHGFNGTDYGGDLEPLTGYLFTNASSDIAYSDGTTPDPLFTYWLTEDLDGDGTLSDIECVVGTCSPLPSRPPALYLWGDDNFDRVLSEGEKASLLTLPVGAAAWGKNPLVSSGLYVTTSLSAAVDPSGGTAYQLEVADASAFTAGMHIELKEGTKTERLVVDEANSSSTPNLIVLSSDPSIAFADTTTSVTAVSTTLLRAVRSIGINFSAITDQPDSNSSVAAVGRAGRAGDGGLDYRVMPFQRKIEVLNAPTVAMPTLGKLGAPNVCPLKIVNVCSQTDTESSIRYTTFDDPAELEFLITDLLDNPIPDIEVSFSNSDSLIGELLKTTATTDLQGKVSLGELDYRLLGVLGRDEITATVECWSSAATLLVDSAEHEIDLHEVILETGEDCLGTVGTRISSSATDFRVLVNDVDGPVSGHKLHLGLGLEDVTAAMSGLGLVPLGSSPGTPDFSTITGDLSIGGISEGTTDATGTLAPVEVTTDFAGEIRGTFGLTRDDASKGVRLNLVAAPVSSGCPAVNGSLSHKLDFFELTLDSTNPHSGCTKYAPCTITAGQDSPEIIANLSINNVPVDKSPVTFELTDIQAPSFGDEFAESRLIPATPVTTDVQGDASARVSNNGSPLITPLNELRTQVDVAAGGSPVLCSNGDIETSSEVLQFNFEAPADLCKVDSNDSWVQDAGGDRVCMHFLNDNEVDGCSQRFAGIQVTVFQTNGITPDNSIEIKKIEGGGVSQTANCSNSGSVRLFEDKCRIPKDKLPNGEQWDFVNFDSCSTPFSAVPQGYYFVIDKIEFEDMPSGRRMDVTVFFSCVDPCDPDAVESTTFTFTTP